MSLQLFELVPTTPSREAAEALIAQVSQAVEAAGASVLESQVTASHERIFTIVELDSDDVTGLTEAVRSAAADAEVTGPDEVRLVGGLRSSGAQDFGSLVLTLLAERCESDDSAVRVEHVRDSAVDVLAGEPQFM